MEHVQANELKPIEKEEINRKELLISNG